MLGAEICYGVVGTANFAITHALVANGIRYIPAMHEANAVMMAYGYARATRKLAVASVHSGPGLTNALTSIAEAAKGKVPLLVIAGDVPTGDVRNNFYFDQSRMAESVGAVSERIYTTSSAMRDLSRALVRVLRDQETVVLSVPEDIQDAPYAGEGDFETLIEQMGTNAFQPPRALPYAALVKALADAVERSTHPLILAGRGATSRGARASLLMLADQINSLLATSLAAHGLFAGEQWSVGISGGFASPAGLELLPQCDLVLGFGVSFTHWTTRQGRLINPSAAIVQIDDDQTRLNVNRPARMAILGDAELTARALRDELLARGFRSHPGWRSESTLATLSRYAAHGSPDDTVDGPDHIDPRLLTYRLNKILPTNRIVVTDSGHFMGWAPLYLSISDEAGWSMPTAFQSVGLAMGCAIGAGMAQPDRLTVLTIGDGGLMMSMSDFATAVNSGLKMCIVVYNDSGYGAEVHYFKHRDFNTDIVKFPVRDFAAIARGFGADAAIVRNTRDLARLTQWVDRGSPGVFLIDARVDPNVEAEWFRDAFTEPTSLSKAHAHLSTAARHGSPLKSLR
jgi:thiamine pyrophosphate-dependent acetolactate synthase large subunit-like protein